MSLTKYAEFEVLDYTLVPKSAGHRRLARLRAQGHRHHFDFTPRPGYLYVRSRAISSRCNDNYDMFPAEEIKQAYRTFVGKPVFVNHKNSNHRRARGVIIDAALHEDTNPDGSPDTWAEVLMEVDAVKFPVLAREIEAGNIARTSMGTDVKYSVCTACGNKAYTPVDYCAHIPKMKGMKVHRTLASGQKQEVLVAEVCYGLGFFENSLLVEPPADPTAFVLGVENGDMAKAASLHTAFPSTRDVADEMEGNKGHGQETTQRRQRAQPAPEDEGEIIHLHNQNTPGFGLGSPERHREVTDEQTRSMEHQHRQLQHQYHPDQPYQRTRGEVSADHPYRRGGSLSAVTMLVESAQCPECNPDIEISAEGALLCRSHNFQQQHGVTAAADDLMRCTNCDGPLKGDYDHVECTKCGWGYDPKSLFADLAHSDGPYAGKVLRIDPLGLAHAVPYSHEAMNRLAYGETKAPSKVDTLRAEACPVCGDDEAFNGEQCNVCGYTQPPEQFRDPDLTKAKEMDLRQEQQDQQDALDPNQGPIEAQAPQAEDLQCTNCGEVFSAEGDPATDTNPDPEAEPGAETTPPEADPQHPDVPEDPDSKKARDPHDLDDLADLPDKELGLEDDEDEKVKAADPDQDPDPTKAPDPTVDPAATGEGRVTPEDDEEADVNREVADQPIEANMTCPICGEGTLIPVDPAVVEQEQDLDPTVDPTAAAPAKPNKVPPKNSSRQSAGRLSKETVDMNQPNPAQQRRNRIIAAIAEQQGVIEGLLAQNKALTRAVATLSVAAGAGRHPVFAGLVREAGLTHLADSAQNPEGAPATTTEEAKQPQATDDVNSVGAAPSEVNKDVTPAAVTDVQNSNVAVNPPVLDNLQDVTAPVAGTDAVVPAAGDAAGTSTVTVGTPSQDSFDSTGPQWKGSSRGDEKERFIASTRLARLQIAAGLEQGEDFVVGEKIAGSGLSLGEIEASISTLTAVQANRQAEAVTAQRTRGLVPRAAQRQGIQPAGAPSLQTQAQAVVSRPGEDEWAFGGDDLG